jgi:hypothetical protein
MVRRRAGAASTTVLALACLLVTSALAGCAQSNATKGTSFTSLSSAATQAQTRVDAAVGTAVPALPGKTVTSLPSEACDSNSGRNAARYEVTVKPTKDQVDAAALAAWRSLAGSGFTLNASSAPATGTDPVAPGAGAPSWTITGNHDGFQAEVVANRADPGLRVWITTPCFGT